jgi:hypothetical protein
VTWALLDPVMTIARPIGAIVSSIFTGACVNWFVRRGWDREPAPAVAPAPVREASCCVHGAAEPAAQALDTAHEHAAHAQERESQGPSEHAHAGHAHAAAAPATSGSVEHAARAHWLVRVLRYAYVDLLDDLTVSLLAGTLLSGAIAVLVPAEVFASPAVHGFAGMLLMLVLGIPIYVCAAASTPIAATLILKGMSPGAAFVFLLASPATNLGSLLALRRHLGTRILCVHVGALAVVTLLLGFAIDGVYAWLALAPHASDGAAHEHLSPWHTVSAFLLAGLMFVSLLRTHGTRDFFAKLRFRAEPAAR